MPRSLRLVASWLALLCVRLAGAQSLPNPVLFVTQTPHNADFTTVAAVFGNHRAEARFAPRGGDLLLRSPDGTLRNLTQEAGYGLAAGQEIAVREPCVHWDAQRALFSMVIGGTTQNDLTPVYWQIYEVRGLGPGEAVQIERVPNQPEQYNNVSPIYGTDGRILFTTDRPRNGDRRLYPQLDEYESAPTVTGVWSFDPAVPGGDLRLLEHAVSGAFSPSLASDGRVVFVRWDHLQRDQQASADEAAEAEGDEPPYGSFDYVSEASDARAPERVETFPEPRFYAGGTPPGAHPHTINHFFPWQMLEDGSGEETLNHVGRHELLDYFDSSRDDLPYHSAPEGETRPERFQHLREDPLRPGRFYGVNCPEFGTHSAGQIVAIEAAEAVNADDLRALDVTHPSTASVVEPGQPLPEPADGLFRNPLALSDGQLVAAHSPGMVYEQRLAEPLGSDHYAFRLKLLVQDGGRLVAGAALTPGIVKSVSYFDNGPYRQLSYSGPMWELDPVELVARPKPATRRAAIEPLERALLERVLADRGGIEALQEYLRARNLALLVSRNVTRRADRQQPYRLAVPGGVISTEPGHPADAIQWISFVQADQVRGYATFSSGRRPIARPMHEAPDAPGAPAGAYPIAADGSFAAVVPARRALSWSLDAPDGTPVVRERYWLTFQPGEIRVCTNCHGTNRTDELGQPPPANEPAALEPLVLSLLPPAGASVPAPAAGLLAAGLAFAAAALARRRRRNA